MLVSLYTDIQKIKIKTLNIMRCVYMHTYLSGSRKLLICLFLLPYSYTEANSIRLMLLKSAMAHLHFILLSHLDFGLIGSFFGTK